VQSFNESEFNPQYEHADKHPRDIAHESIEAECSGCDYCRDGMAAKPRACDKHREGDY